jgi:hypothetical protein
MLFKRRRAGPARGETEDQTMQTTDTTTANNVREEWLQAFVAKARPTFEAIGAPIPSTVRVSIGFPSGGKRGKAIGECWSSACSGDGHFEIFIHPGQADSSRIADILTHELIHAAVGLEAKHGPRFAKVARDLGLTGKMTATVAGDRWHEWADPIVAELGPIPHAALSGMSSGPKKQTTRLIKCECDQCGFTFRTTAKWIAEAVERAEDQDDASMRCPIPACEGEIALPSGDDGEGED